MADFCTIDSYNPMDYKSTKPPYEAGNAKYGYFQLPFLGSILYTSGSRTP